MGMIKILFFGTPKFAVDILDQIIESKEYNLVGVVTQPDKEVGRKRIMTPPPVKSYIQSKSLGTEIFQPIKLRLEYSEILKKTQPDIIIVAAYGQIIPKEVLEFPKYLCLNIHGSLLPDLRGAVPVPMALIKGYKQTGVSIQIMAEKLDAGDVLASQIVAIGDDDDTESLKSKLAVVGGKLLLEILPKWISGELKPEKQDETKATFCWEKDISKDKAQIDWGRLTAFEVDRYVKGLNPWPIAWTIIKSEDDPKDDHGIIGNEKFKGKKLLIYKSKILDNDFPHLKDGKLFKKDKSLIARCKYGWLEILECQLEGKTRMSGKDYLYLADDTTTVGRAILIHDRKILLMQRIKNNDEYYLPPGGSIRVNESIEQGVIREFKEETNLDIKPGKFLFDIFSSGGLKRDLYYEAELISSNTNVVMVGEENIYSNPDNFYDVKWVDLKEALDLPIFPEVRNYIQSYLKS